jgi:muramoyltetrapeptide carboxypeptidase LdcA involved in peptidoglycan recycling
MKCEQQDFILTELSFEKTLFNLSHSGIFQSNSGLLLGHTQCYFLNHCQIQSSSIMKQILCFLELFVSFPLFPDYLLGGDVSARQGGRW